MMNSMSRNEVVDGLIHHMKGLYDIPEVIKMSEYETALVIQPNELHQILIYLKPQGFKQLSAVTCVDYIEENCFQLIYNIFDWEVGIRFILRVRIPREDAKFESITSIYPGAKYYEREVHEFFGIQFEGNPDSMKQLFLERWDDIPPLRKDFDARAYSDRKYIKREYKKSFGKPGGEPIERD